MPGAAPPVVLPHPLMRGSQLRDFRQTEDFANFLNKEGLSDEGADDQAKK